MSARARRLSALIGRDAELAWLRTAWERAAVVDSQVVVLAGEAGVGKTRLLAAFLQGVTRDDAAIVIARRCPPLAVGELPRPRLPMRCPTWCGRTRGNRDDPLVGWLADLARACPL